MKLDPSLEAEIARRIAAGEVTLCPPFAFTEEAGATGPRWISPEWKGRQRRIAARQARFRALAEREAAQADQSAADRAERGARFAAQAAALGRAASAPPAPRPARALPETQGRAAATRSDVGIPISAPPPPPPAPPPPAPPPAPAARARNRPGLDARLGAARAAEVRAAVALWPDRGRRFGPGVALQAVEQLLFADWEEEIDAAEIARRAARVSPGDGPRFASPGRRLAVAIWRAK